jgi:hypothetical protein
MTDDKEVREVVFGLMDLGAPDVDPELIRRAVDLIGSLIDERGAAVLAERERCARVCQDLAEGWDQKGYWDEKDALGEAANAIRKGDE